MNSSDNSRVFVRYEKEERLRILTVKCPVCNAKPFVNCTAISDIEVYGPYMHRGRGTHYLKLLNEYSSGRNINGQVSCKE